MSTTVEPTTTRADRNFADKMARIRARAQKPIERTITLYDEDLQTAVNEAEIELGKAHALARKELEAKHSTIKDDAARLKKVEAEMPKNRLVKERQGVHDTAVAELEAAAIKFTFRALEPIAYDILVAEHPPTPEQRKIGHRYNVETFGPAIIAASSTDDMTVEDANDLIAACNTGEANTIFGTAIGVNESQSRVLLGKG